MTDRSDQALELKRRELELQERGLDLVGRKAKSERWSNPLTVAVIAAALAAFTNAYLAYVNNQAQVALERSRAESERILEMLRVGDPARVRENLRFLLQLGLVQDEGLRRRIIAWEANPNRAPFYLRLERAAARETAAGSPPGAGPRAAQPLREAEAARREERSY